MYHCISVPQFRIYQENLSEDLVFMVPALVQSSGGASLPLYLWAALGPVRGCESSSVSSGYLQVRLVSLCDLPALNGDKIEGLATSL